MKYLITVEFWKQLFDYTKSSNYGSSLIYVLSMNRRRFINTFSGFTGRTLDLDGSVGVDASTSKRGPLSPLGGTVNRLLGVGSEQVNMVLMCAGELNAVDKIYQTVGGRCKVGQLVLVVIPEWKHMRVSHRLYKVGSDHVEAISDGVTIDLGGVIG